MAKFLSPAIYGESARLERMGLVLWRLLPSSRVSGSGRSRVSGRNKAMPPQMKDEMPKIRSGPGS